MKRYRVRVFIAGLAFAAAVGGVGAAAGTAGAVADSLENMQVGDCLQVANSRVSGTPVGCESLHATYVLVERTTGADCSSPSATITHRSASELFCFAPHPVGKG